MLSPPQKPATGPTAASAEATHDDAAAKEQQQASAPATPPFSSSRHGSTTASTSTPSPRPPSSFTDDSSVPQEGLNGSNVPGLPPQAAQNPAQSVPTSRRASGLPEDLTASDQLRLASNRRSVNGAVDGLTSSLDRMGLGQQATATQGTAGQRGSSTASSASPIGLPSSNQGPIFGSPASNAPNGQQTLLQRAMNRSILDGGQQQHLHVQQQQSQQAHQPSDASLTPVFNERFLFSDDELEADDSTFVKKYNLNEDDNSFPVLIRHENQPGMLSASSAALDLAPLAQTPSRFHGRDDVNSSEWPQFAQRDATDGIAANNGAHGSMGGNVLGQAGGAGNGGAESFDRFGARRGRSERNSPRVSAGGAAGGRGGVHMTTTPVAPGSMGQDGRLPRSSAGSHYGPGAGGPRPGNNNGLGGQGFHTPQDRSIDDLQRKDHGARAGHSQDSQQSGVGKNMDGTSANSAAAFAPFAMGPGYPGDVKRNGAGALNAPVGRFGPSYPGFDQRGSGGDPNSRSGSAGFFEAFAPPPMGKSGAGMQQKGPTAGPRISSGNNNAGTDGFALGSNEQTGPNGVGLKSQQASQQQQQQQRKGELDTSTPLEDLQGEIFALCKDQHGCRYLQKKLEEGNPTYRDMIFTETFSHFAELMTDPFGNYLCQKMLEYCTDDQRNLIVESVAPDLVGISLNMHGTRAVQKTIDFLSTPRQIHSIIIALGMNVVPLIKDLNGNHVVQKCLNRLNASDNQFIYDAVATHCVEVATHRHGCCVLQRCIDHASDKQRMQLVQEITFHALTLVQDPFGNYVVQYILDLNDSRYSEALVRQFVGHVCNLSVQKFSSNVIEKCIRVSEPGVRKQLIDELLNRTRLEKLLRDSFANYVVQTSLDYADPVQRMQLVECIKPTLPMIRNTPYGKRIQSKLQRDNIDLGGPAQGSMPYGLLQAAAHQQQQMHAMAAMAHRQGATGGAGPGGEFGPAGAMHHQGGPYLGGGNGNSNAQGGNYMPIGNQRSFSGRHIPPPQTMYGGAGAPGSAGRSASAGYSGNYGGNVNNGVIGVNQNHNGAAGFVGGGGVHGSPSAVGGSAYNRPPPQQHHAMGFGHPPPQQGFTPNSAMQNSYGNGTAAAFHGQAQYGGQF